MEKTYTVPEERRGCRLDHCLGKVIPGNSRSFYQKLIKSGYVEVNGKPVSPGHRLRPGDRIRVMPAGSKASGPGYGKLSVIYEDKVFAVINKPPGITVHPPFSRRDDGGLYMPGIEPALTDILVKRWPELKKLGPRPGIVHRLDRDTSGIMVVARSRRAAEQLSRQFTERTVSKMYSCIAEGRFNEKKGVIDAPLIRKAPGGKKFRVGAGRNAVTEFSVARNLGDGNSLLEVKPLTGRTHQIRVHLAAIGHPVLGDKTYGTGKKEYSFISRQMLHSHKLCFMHPASGKPLMFSAPLPDDFRTALKKLKI